MKDLFEDLEKEEDKNSLEKNQEKEEDVLSVSDFLETVNDNLKSFSPRVKGEVTSVSKRSSYLRFKIKDEEDESILKCFMWKNDYKVCGVEIEEGKEIIVQGHPEIYKPYGEFSFQTKTVELVGKGALMKAYKKLKKKLKKEGVFSEDRKRDLPPFPKKIGVITSLRGGTVIHDFENNLEKFGFKIKGIDARVEGKKAVKSLLSAIEKAEKLDLDVLVIIRGGGSIESLQAFDNEALVREVVDFEVPVIAGIGHHEDKTLVSLAADRAESTPQGVAEMLNKPWKEADKALALYQQKLFSKFDKELKGIEKRLDKSSRKLQSNFEKIIDRFRTSFSKIKKFITEFGYKISKTKENLKKSAQFLARSMDSELDKVSSKLNEAEKILEANDPERQLSLGYSLVSNKEGNLIRSVDGVEVGEDVEIKVVDGNIISEVTDKDKN